MKTIEKIKKEIEEKAKEYDEELKIIFVEEKQPINNSFGVYFRQKKIIMINVFGIIKGIERYKKGNEKYTVENLMWMTFLHELGHHIDFKNGGYERYLNSYEHLWKMIRNGDKKEVKEAFMEFQRELKTIEERAWENGKELLPNDIEKELYEDNEKRSLKTYYNSYKVSYRSTLMKVKIISYIKELMKNSETYKVVFDDFRPTHHDIRTKTKYLNVRGAAMRKRTKTQVPNEAIEITVNLFNELLFLRRYELPKDKKCKEDLDKWFKEELKKLDENVEKIKEHIGSDETYIELYKSTKLEMIVGVLNEHRLRKIK